MNGSLLKKMRFYGLLLAGAVFFCMCCIMLLLYSSAQINSQYYVIIFILMFTLMLTIGWVFFRLQVLLLDPLKVLTLKTRELQTNKEFTEPLRVSDPHILPSEIHDVLSSYNALIREIHDRDNKLTARQAELVRLRSQVSVAKEAKANFISNINHEIRTPLNAIIGFSGVMIEQQLGAINEQYIEFSKEIKSSGEKLLSLLSDIIALSKVELGTLKLKMEQFNALHVIEKCIALEQSAAHARNITVSVESDAKLPPLIADRIRFMQIIQHLLTNAIKYNHDNGKIVFHVSAEPANNHVYFYRIIVKNTGESIAKEKMTEIFEYFSPMEKGFKQHEAGKGLGLPLVKKLVEIHNGSLHIDGTSEGTTITVQMISDPGTLD